MLKTLEIDLKDPKNDLTVLYNVRGFNRVSASVVPYLNFCTYDNIYVFVHLHCYSSWIRTEKGGPRGTTILHMHD